MRKALLILCWCGLLAFPAWCEEENHYFDSTQSFNIEMDAFSGRPDANLLLANSAPEYPVTPGDVYKLTYLGSPGSVSYELVVASDFTVNLILFGTINAHNKTYAELRRETEALIDKAYPGSRPQLVLQSTGLFQVYLQGEVKNAESITCWGLSRLHTILKGRTTPYSSTRDITVLPAGGKRQQYDLFAWLRSGNREQDPLLKPGDTVILQKVLRQVKLTGAVFRPGTYQLLAGENLAALCSGYGEGFTLTADPARIRLIRYDTSAPGEMLYLDNASPEFDGIELHNLDAVFVPAKDEQLPVVYFEGALDASNRNTVYAHTYLPGETLSTAFKQVYTKFNANSLLAAAYIIRAGQAQSIPVNLELLLYSYREALDYPLEPYDRIVIPFRQYFVTVSGAVLIPGQYPYIPDKDYLYYLHLAGGIDPAKNSNEQVIIKDKEGRAQPMTRLIQPEDSLFAEYNSPLYHLERWAPVIELAVSITALVMGILQLTK